MSFWGSLGRTGEMNKMIARFMKDNVDAGLPFQHIHSAGSFGWKWMPEYVKEQGVDLNSTPAIDMREFIYDMPNVMAAADLVICRAGAATIAEVAAAGKPAIFVPSPNVTDNHQEKNARIIEHQAAPWCSGRASAAGISYLTRQRDCWRTPRDSKRWGGQRKRWRFRIPLSGS